MARRPLAEGLAESIQESIVDGTYPPGSQVPNENELSRESGLSRPTVREAIKLLQMKGLVRIVAGRGTFVSPMTEWSLLDPVLLVARSKLEADSSTWSRRLLEARRLVEVGSAGIAAEHRTDQHLAELGRLVTTMAEAAATNNVVQFVDADIRFHSVILEATGNSFIVALFNPLEEVLRLTRYQTSAHSDVRKHAMVHHENILRALTAGDSAGSADAMSRHIAQTESDFVQFVTDPEQSLFDFRADPLDAGEPPGSSQSSP